jgi:hypothetical protein
VLDKHSAQQNQTCGLNKVRNGVRDEWSKKEAVNGTNV